MADETQDSLRQAINRILGFSPGGSAGTGTSSGVSAPMEGPKYGTYGTAEEAIKTAGKTPFSNISGAAGTTASTTNSITSPAATSSPAAAGSGIYLGGPAYQQALLAGKAPTIGAGVNLATSFSPEAYTKMYADQRRALEEKNLAAYGAPTYTKIGDQTITTWGGGTVTPGPGVTPSYIGSTPPPGVVQPGIIRRY